MLRKPIVGIIGFSDGDPEVHEELKDIVQKQVDVIEEALRGSGQVEVIVADKLVASERDAKEQAELLRSRGVDITVFSYGVFAFPQFFGHCGPKRERPLCPCRKFESRLARDGRNACGRRCTQPSWHKALSCGRRLPRTRGPEQAAGVCQVRSRCDPAQRTEIRTDRWTEPWDVQRSGQYAGLAETIRRRY